MMSRAVSGVVRLPAPQVAEWRLASFASLVSSSPRLPSFSSSSRACNGHSSPAASALPSTKSCPGRQTASSSFRGGPSVASSVALLASETTAGCLVGFRAEPQKEARAVRQRSGHSRNCSDSPSLGAGCVSRSSRALGGLSPPHLFSTSRETPATCRGTLSVSWRDHRLCASSHCSPLSSVCSLSPRFSRSGLHSSSASSPLSWSGSAAFSRGGRAAFASQRDAQFEGGKCQEETVSKNFKTDLIRMQWPAMRDEMARFFQAQNAIAFDKISKRHPSASLSSDASSSSSSSSSPSDSRGEHREAAEEVDREEQGKLSFAEMVVGSTRSACGVLGAGRSSAVDVACKPWERFVRKEDIQRAGYVPCIVEKYGVERRLAIHRSTLEALAFDEQHGHLSYLFQARLFRLRIGNWIEECIPTFVQADPVARRLYFVKFERHVAGKISEVDIPTTMVGLLACPAYQRGYHVELVMPTIRCQCVGAEIPPPFFVDVSRLHYSPPYTAITLQDLQHLLPADGSARFHPSYDAATQEVAWAYEVGTLPDAPLPADYVDPNFVDRKGQKMDVCFRNHFPN
ncbi:UNVERIFIED_CONTAM: ribosomal l25 family protein [Hammondia hammondi]|eukprot:XP_008883501.1 ribosomal l25 family protein [Hammondia hammondi]